MANDNLHFSQLATVHSQLGEEVLVSVRLEGFPAGFQLRPGDQVALMHTDSGMLAFPVVDNEVVDAVTRNGLLESAVESANIEFSKRGAYPAELKAAEGKQTTVRAWTVQTTRQDYARLVVGAREELDSNE